MGLVGAFAQRDATANCQALPVQDASNQAGDVQGPGQAGRHASAQQACKPRQRVGMQGTGSWKRASARPLVSKAAEKTAHQQPVGHAGHGRCVNKKLGWLTYGQLITQDALADRKGRGEEATPPRQKHDSQSEEGAVKISEIALE